MPVFEYKGLNEKGKPVKGILDAEGPRVLREVLMKQNIFLTEYNEGSEQSAQPLRQRRMGGSVKGQDVAILTRQLATLTKAGISLVESLSALVDQVEKEALRRILSSVRQKVNEGSSLADAFSAYPRVFPPLYTNMIRAGEASGMLDVVLDRLADFTDYQVKLKSKIIGAMTYPVIMVIFSMIIVAVLFVVVIPKITRIFAHLKSALPLPTKILIGSSKFVGQWWWLILILMVLMVLMFLSFIKSEKGHIKWDRFKLRVPILGSMIRMLAIARFSRTLSTLLASGVPILMSLEIVKNVLNNKILEAVVEEARENIKEGESIAAPLARSGQFPPIVTHMIAVGEKSGQLEEMLNHIADAYDSQVDTKVNAMTALLEPIMIVAMGGVVGFIVFSILLPILKMNQALGKG